jgi:hypothetical protein
LIIGFVEISYDCISAWLAGRRGRSIVSNGNILCVISGRGGDAWYFVGAISGMGEVTER